MCTFAIENPFFLQVVVLLFFPDFQKLYFIFGKHCPSFWHYLFPW